MGSTDRTNLPAIQSPEHRAVARKAVAKSQVLLKNAGQILPFRTKRRYAAGHATVTCSLDASDPIQKGDLVVVV